MLTMEPVQLNSDMLWWVGQDTCRYMAVHSLHVLLPQHTRSSDPGLVCCTPAATCCAQVTFLYKLTDGACPKSYGVNVARLAGLPDSVLQRASAFSAELEAQHQQKQVTVALVSNQYTVNYM